jgi:hypothetical protein
VVPAAAHPGRRPGGHTARALLSVHVKRVGPRKERRKNMSVTKGIAALTLAVLAIPAQGVYGGTISYIVSEDTPTELKLTVNHPDSTFGSKTFTLAPPLTNWSVNGTVKDYNAGLFARGLDTVTFKGVGVQHKANPHAGETAAPTFSVPDFTASAGPAGNFTVPLVKFAQSAVHPGGATLTTWKWSAPSSTTGQIWEEAISIHTTSW